MKKVLVVLSGCGVFDGAEIHESVLSLLALDEAGAEVTCTAPDIDQVHVINHVTGEVIPDESRNVLVESARIARGKIKSLDEIQMENFDAILFPGGFGAAKNLSNFALKGTDASVHPEVERVLKEAHTQKKPIGLLCISPSIATQVLGDLKIQFTIGTDQDTAQALETWGATHKECPFDSVVIDSHNKIVSSPAYMTAEKISQINIGIRKLVASLLELCD